MICCSAFRNTVAEKFPVSPKITIVSFLFTARTFVIFADAIAWEKQLKGWRRSKKNALVERDNPHWRDLAANWF